MVNVGDRVKMLSNHWTRPGAEGVIVERAAVDILEEPSEDRVLVRFDKKGVGLGGHFLFCHEKEFKVTSHARPPKDQ